MKNRIWTWIVDTLKDFRKALIAFFVASGIGALIYTFVKKIGIQTYDLISNHIIEIGIVLLFALFYLLGKQNGKNKTKRNTISVIQHDLIQIDSLKWDVTLYSNNHFDIGPMPYCPTHDMKLVEQWPLLFCPRYGECNTHISRKDLSIAIASAESNIESQLRKQKI